MLSDFYTGKQAKIWKAFSYRQFYILINIQPKVLLQNHAALVLNATLLYMEERKSRPSQETLHIRNVGTYETLNVNER